MSVKALWTWGGKFYGFQDGINLWSCDGRHTGRFEGEEVYGPDGRYLGELRSDNRLIRNRSRAAIRGPSFAPYGRRVGSVPYVGYVGYVMIVGYEDFPSA
jgi:hypothetical protein